MAVRAPTATFSAAIHDEQANGRIVVAGRIRIERPSFRISVIDAADEDGCRTKDRLIERGIPHLRGHRPNQMATYGMPLTRQKMTVNKIIAIIWF